MRQERDYDKFTKTLAKQFFTMEQIRSFIESDFVEVITKEEPDKQHPNKTKYAIKLTDGDIYHVYVK